MGVIIAVAHLAVLAVLAVFVLQVWNRHGKGKRVAPAQIFKAHMGIGVLLVVFAVVHGVSKLAGGHAPMPSVVTGLLLAVALIATVALGSMTKSSKGARRRSLARAHGMGACCVLVLLVAHLAVRIAM